MEIAEQKKAMDRYDLTDEHMEKFRDSVKSLIGAFGMTDWLIDFTWIDDPENDALAQVQTSTADRTALFQLNRKWTDLPTPQRIERTAYHEILEVLLAPIRTIARLDETDVTPVGKICLLESECRIIIRRLENCYMGAW